MDRKTYAKEYHLKNKDKHNKQSTEWRINNPEKRAEIQKRYTENNKDKVRERAFAWFDRNKEKRILANARLSSKVRGLEFSITIEDIIIPTHCPYLGIELTPKSGQGRLPSNPSIDRIDNSKGYVKGNVQVISLLANKMKAEATREELIKFAKSVLYIHGDDNEG